MQGRHLHFASHSVVPGGLKKHVSRNTIVAAWIIPANSLPPVDLAAQPDFSHNYVKIGHYGDQLIKNKDFVAEAAKKAGARDDQRALMMAIAMQVSSTTEHMHSSAVIKAKNG